MMMVPVMHMRLSAVLQRSRLVSAWRQWDGHEQQWRVLERTMPRLGMMHWVQSVEHEQSRCPVLVAQ